MLISFETSKVGQTKERTKLELTILVPEKNQTRALTTLLLVSQPPQIRGELGQRCCS
ncbi:hypothetical protein Syun_016935 [Stephania yunnanensis]|uniref:Uncharacterized protein n=1 Tax=Stephania yunnanensis TaxID=152371 RepID=A0AAP0P2L3_9MAGN